MCGGEETGSGHKAVVAVGGGGSMVRGGAGASNDMALFLDPGIHYVSGPFTPMICAFLYMYVIFQ